MVEKVISIFSETIPEDSTNKTIEEMVKCIYFSVESSLSPTNHTRLNGIKKIIVKDQLFTKEDYSVLKEIFKATPQIKPEDAAQLTHEIIIEKKLSTFHKLLVNKNLPDARDLVNQLGDLTEKQFERLMAIFDLVFPQTYTRDQAFLLNDILKKV